MYILNRVGIAIVSTSCLLLLLSLNRAAECYLLTTLAPLFNYCKIMMQFCNNYYYLILITIINNNFNCRCLLVLFIVADDSNIDFIFVFCYYFCLISLKATAAVAK